MKDFSVRISYYLKCRQEDIPDIIRMCEAQIKKETTEYPLESIILTKVKWIISEFLTNAAKHSGADRCELKIMISDEKLIIEKEDFGPPLIMTDNESGKKISWPIKQTESINFQIYHNGSDSLRVRCNGNNEAIFFIDQLENLEMPALLADISEHFGLLIVTKASDLFKYEFDLKSKINRFTSHFNLK